MRGSPRAIPTRLPRAVPSRQWSSRVAGLVEQRRRITAERHETIERLAREQRSARRSGQPISEPRYRIRPW
jgi:hypothetical protein